MEYIRTVHYYLEEAHKAAKSSPCLKKKVGAVLVDPEVGDIISSGFGGANFPCEKCVRKEYEWQQDGCWSIHSEIRAILNYLPLINGGGPLSLAGMYMFVTHGPCDQCIKYMEYFGIERVYFDVPYHNDYSKWKGKIEIWEKDVRLI